MNKNEYIQTVISAFTVKPPPIELINDYYNESGEPWDYQDFVSDNLKPEFRWSTAYGIIEAAELIVKEAYHNANIK